MMLKKFAKRARKVIGSGRSSRMDTRPSAEQEVIRSLGLLPKPRGAALANVLAVATSNRKISPRAFDALRIADGPTVDLTDRDDVRRNRNRIEFVEIKTTNRSDINANFDRYFFSVADCQWQAGRKLGKRYKFCFFNRKTGDHIMLTKRQLEKRFKSVTLSYSVQI